ncbi:tail protein X [Maridesulfovibrio sp.]|uniref:tail protein X n=1 Tax=Maridesulfovibrio sp. TaxID=2795000 RepID=UPI003B003D9B
MANTYTTVSGDLWDTIAQQLYGRETMCSKLMATNPEHAGTVIFKAGIVLNVPDVETPSNAEITTPPWRVQS